ncbi:MAG: DUF1028 domain-containing protein [Acidobacteriota bacterium]|nr:DUF1028 domain-containing protein [Acidobacteriota bacterium]
MSHRSRAIPSPLLVSAAVFSALLLAILGIAGPSAAEGLERTSDSALSKPLDPLAHTYSIVARDPATGQLGVAVQSHWFQVGAVVPWARAGVGAVATQSFVRVDYGPKGLDLMAAGTSASQALDQLLAEDPQRSVRQVAMVDHKGRVAAWTGEQCIAEAGHHRGDGYSVQANLMLADTVPEAMAKAYEKVVADSAEDFAGRLLAALEAAQGEGGDIRGRQSAALLVVRAESTGNSWEDRLVDLRVDDHAEPLVELRRLLERHRAYDEMNRGDEAMATGDLDAAVGHYTRAADMAPEIVELPFWKAVTLFDSGATEQALPIFQEVFEREERWREVLRRLPAAGLLKAEAVAVILGEEAGEGAAASEAAEGTP